MDEPEITTPLDLLKELRWEADRIVVSPTFGERYWLKKTDDGRAITDCCPADDPCEYHAKLTHAASGTRQ